MVAEKTTAELWREYRSSKSIAIRNALVTRYMSLVRAVASKFKKSLPQHVDVEDLASVGAIALMRLVEHFELDRNNQFSTFAIPRLRGAMIDELRRLDFVPRSRRDFERRFNAIETELASAFGRKPTQAEVAGELEIDEADLMSRLASFEMVSLFHNTDDGEGYRPTRFVDVIADSRAQLPCSRLHHADTVKEFTRGINRRERQIAELYFVDRIPMRKIGQQFGLCESRISMIIAEIKPRLINNLFEMVGTPLPAED